MQHSSAASDQAYKHYFCDNTKKHCNSQVQSTLLKTALLNSTPANDSLCFLQTNMHDFDEDDILEEDEEMVEDEKQRKSSKRRRTDIAFIADRTKRNVCYAKRKRGLLKKAAELRRLTGIVSKFCEPCGLTSNRLPNIYLCSQ